MDTPFNFASARLEDRYDAERGYVFLTGVQALVRLPLLRQRLDREQGLNTAGFISGYRGSPLGSYDKQLWQERKRLAAQNVIFRPGVNEELGVTAVWGSQQVGLFPGAKFDGVFGIWYGKGPGVDRAGDALKHANFFGTSKHGGVLAFAGDDHSCKSSTLPNQSDLAFADAEIPVLSPAGVEELLEFGLKGFALSRFAGLWTGMKTIADTMDASATVPIDFARYRTFAPGGVVMPPHGVHARVGLSPAQQEEVHRHFRIPAAIAFAKANGFDRIAVDSAQPKVGIAASGKAYLHVRQALRDLGLEGDAAEKAGVRVYKVGLVWPLEPAGAKAFADGLETVLVVEERRDVIEQQLRAVAYDLPDGRRPRIFGKRDADGKPLISDVLDIDTADVISALYRILPREVWPQKMQAMAERHTAQQSTLASSVVPLHTRSAYFCSGCPHNTSTVVPEGSRALAGIGCHYLASLMDRKADTYTQMGGEGVPWMGQAPFTSEKHIFANLGDGTYFHSGSLAIRQAVAAGDNITFKILYNDAVAMTGGQPVDGQLTVAQMAAQVRSEGVERIAIVSDDPERHRYDAAMPAGVSFDHRSRLEAVQKELREVEGVSVLIYDQVCATEKRRRRKRGTMERETRRIFINEAVCEGCGDCSVKSNCLSVEPLETEFGRKRTINQSSCNQDYSCVEGFCPSFVSVYGASAKKPQASAVLGIPLPPAQLPSIPEDGYNILITGIGGLGVTSTAAILGTAAHLQNSQVRVVDQLGMAQKGGGVYSHIRVGRPDSALFSPRIGQGQADLMMAADMVVAHGKSGLPMLSANRTSTIADMGVTPTAEFVTNNAVQFDSAGMAARLKAQSSTFHGLPVQKIAVALLGDAIFSNMILVGYAWQSGLLPIERGALLRAIELNGAAVDANKRAFEIGRAAVVDLGAVMAHVAPAPRLAQTLDEILAIRAADLTAYQDEAYAARYRMMVERVRLAERKVSQDERLSVAVAKNLYKLMAIKDEYEVARLYSDGRFGERLRREFGADTKVKVHLAPPLLSRRNPDTGLPEKRTFGPWVLTAMGYLAKLKSLRGTRWDIFGRTAERRMERELLADYERRIEALLPSLTRSTLELAVAYASVPDMIRGFGHVKERNVVKAQARYAELEQAFSRADSELRAAE
jgi:indolepyruvate ferredoxin oxidoreductase